MARGVNSQPSYILGHAIIHTVYRARACIHLQIESTIHTFALSSLTDVLVRHTPRFLFLLATRPCYPSYSGEHLRWPYRSLSRSLNKRSVLLTFSHLLANSDHGNQICVLVRMQGCIWRSFIQTGVKIIA